MVTPFYNAVKGTTAGTPGTGAFTPNAASSGFRAWSTVPTGWIGMVRYEDGSAWELEWSYWNGTTLSRAATQLYDSSSGSQLTLTSAATAAMIVDASEVMSHLGGTPWRVYVPVPGSTTPSLVGLPVVTTNGTAGSNIIGNTSYQFEQPRIGYTSATTASAQGGPSMTAFVATINTTAGRGGFEFVCRFGPAGLPTGPRLFVGLTSVTAVAATEASALAASIAAFAKDSTDTNIQLLAKDGTTANKVDTGMVLTTGGWYEASVWAEPGSNKIYGLLIRLDTGAIWFGSTTTNVPLTTSQMMAQVLGGLNATNTGTAFVMAVGSICVRSGS